MAKIAFLGAGSFGFGRRLIGDLLSFPELVDSTIHLVDPDSERLELTHTYAQRIVSELNLPTQIAASTERKPALDGANYVIVSIRVGANMGPEALDVQIPLEVGGLRQTVSDTVGIGGLMKGCALSLLCSTSLTIWRDSVRTRQCSITPIPWR